MRVSHKPCRPRNGGLGGGGRSVQLSLGIGSFDTSVPVVATRMATGSEVLMGTVFQVVVAGLFLAGAQAAPAPSGPEVARDELVFAPKKGVRLKQTFEMISELKLVDETKLASRDFGICFDDEQTIIFSDEYHSMKDGGATRISRTFETLSRQSQAEVRWASGSVGRDEREGTSELEGLTVIFTWAEDEEKYAVEFAEEDEDEDEDLLEDLDAHADLTWFLPESEVDEGDSWDLEMGAFLALTSPGGNTKIKSADEAKGSLLIPMLRQNLEGDITCTYEGAQDGIAKVAIEMELQSRFEQDEPGLVSMSYSYSFELKGELRWNVEAGHASTLLLEGELECELLPPIEHFGFETRLIKSFEGPLRIKVTIE